MATIMRAPAISTERRTLASPVQEGAEQPAPSAPEAVAGDPEGLAQPAGPAVPVNAAKLREERAALERLQLLQEQERERERLAARELERQQAQRQQLEIAYQEARERGYQDGFGSGDEDARGAFVEAQVRLEAIAAKLEEAQNSNFANMEDIAVCIVYEAICKIVGESMQTRDGVLAQVRQVTLRVRERGALQILLHPRDLDLVQEREVFGLGAPRNSIEWVADESLAMGGCVVESAGGHFEARLDAQLEQIKAVLAAQRNARSCVEREL